jgi:hypothetical protein
MVEMNAIVFAEFRRITGDVNTLHFAPWWASRVREVIRLQVSEVRTEADLHLAAAQWGRLTRAEQQARFLAYLTGLRPLADA